MCYSECGGFGNSVSATVFDNLERARAACRSYEFDECRSVLERSMGREFVLCRSCCAAAGGLGNDESTSPTACQLR